MLKVMAEGWISTKVQEKTGKNGKYVVFSMAANEGYGNSAHVEFLSCIAFNEVAEKMMKAKVQKGSHVYIDGKASMNEFKKKNGEMDKAIRVQISDWRYISGGKKEENEEKGDDNKNSGNNKQNAHEGVTVDDDDDLPF